MKAFTAARQANMKKWDELSPSRNPSPQLRSIDGYRFVPLNPSDEIDLRLGSREWIEQRHAGRGNVGNIAGHKCQAVHLGSRRQQTVDQG
jgi:hypothetical protein